MGLFIFWFLVSSAGIAAMPLAFPFKEYPVVVLTGFVCYAVLNAANLSAAQRGE